METAYSIKIGNPLLFSLLTARHLGNITSPPQDIGISHRYDHNKGIVIIKYVQEDLKTRREQLLAPASFIKTKAGDIANCESSDNSDGDIVSASVLMTPTYATKTAKREVKKEAIEKQKTINRMASKREASQETSSDDTSDESSDDSNSDTDDNDISDGDEFRDEYCLWTCAEQSTNFFRGMDHIEITPGTKLNRPDEIINVVHPKIFVFCRAKNIPNYANVEVVEINANIKCVRDDDTIVITHDRDTYRLNKVSMYSGNVMYFQEDNKPLSGYQDMPNQIRMVYSGIDAPAEAFDISHTTVKVDNPIFVMNYIYKMISSHFIMIKQMLNQSLTNDVNESQNCERYVVVKLIELVLATNSDITFDTRGTYKLTQYLPSGMILYLLLMSRWKDNGYEKHKAKAIFIQCCPKYNIRNKKEVSRVFKLLDGVDVINYINDIMMQMFTITNTSSMGAHNDDEATHGDDKKLPGNNDLSGSDSSGSDYYSSSDDYDSSINVATKKLNKAAPQYSIDEEWFTNAYINVLSNFVKEYDTMSLTNDVYVDNRKLTKNIDRDVGKALKKDAGSLFENVQIRRSDIRHVTKNHEMYGKNGVQYIYHSLGKNGSLDLKTDIRLVNCNSESVGVSTLNTCCILETISGLGIKYFIKDVGLSEYINSHIVCVLDPVLLGKYVMKSDIWSYDETNGTFSIGCKYRELTLGDLYTHNKDGDLARPLLQLLIFILKLKEYDLAFGDIKTDNVMVEVKVNNNGDPSYNIKVVDWESMCVRPKLATQNGEHFKYIYPSPYVSPCYVSANGNDRHVPETQKDMYEYFMVVIDCLIYLKLNVYMPDVHKRIHFLEIFSDMLTVGETAMRDYLALHYNCRSDNAHLIKLVKIIYKLHLSCLKINCENIAKYVYKIALMAHNGVMTPKMNELISNSDKYYQVKNIFKYTNKQALDKQTYHTPSNTVNLIGLFNADKRVGKTKNTK